MVWSGPEWSFSSCPLSGRLTLSISLSQSSETRTQSDSHHRIAQVSEPLTIKVNPGKFPSEEFCFRASLFNQRFLHIMHIALPCRFIYSIFFLICNSRVETTCDNWVKECLTWLLVKISSLNKKAKFHCAIVKQIHQKLEWFVSFAARDFFIAQKWSENRNPIKHIFPVVLLCVRLRHGWLNVRGCSANLAEMFQPVLYLSSTVIIYQIGVVYCIKLNIECQQF